MSTSEEVLERKATLARERLLRVVDALDHKRHELTDKGKAIAHAAAPARLALFGIGGALAVGAAALLLSRLTQKPRRRVGGELGQALARRVSPAPGFWSQVAHNSMVAVTSFALTHAGRFLVQTAIAELEKRREKPVLPPA